jgi:hypothetical protein
MLGNLAAQATALSHAQTDVLCPVTRAAQRPTTARICRKGCITYTHTYALNGILTRDFTRRRHAPATAIHGVILRLEGGLPIRPIAIR